MRRTDASHETTIFTHNKLGQVNDKGPTGPGPGSELWDGLFFNISITETPERRRSMKIISKSYSSLK